MKKEYSQFPRQLGEICRNFRRGIGKTLSDVANDTGYTISNISAFERGKNNNAYIYMWYTQHGLMFFCPINERKSDNDT